MKKILGFLLAISMLVATTAAFADVKDFNITTTEKDKVIYDTDMLYLGDDSYCLYALLQADALGYLELLGCTTVGGNCTVAEGTMSILRQLEIVERPDIPVYIGTDVPMMGLRSAEYFADNGLSYPGTIDTLNTFGANLDYQKLPDEIFNRVNWGGGSYADWGYSELKAQDLSAAEFMVEQVRKHPGEVTILAVGACTNVALACMLDHTFAENTKGIIYMGGAIDVLGNVTGYAELNWYHDAESVQICLNSKFPSQTVVPHDISYNVTINKEAVDMIRAKNNTPITKLLCERAGYERYDESPDMSWSVWDLCTIAPLMVPELITRQDTRKILIDTSRGPTYGLSATWKTADNANDWGAFEGPYYAPVVDIVYDLDATAFWTFISDLYGTSLK